MSAYLIDWLTLRVPAGRLGPDLAARMRANFGYLTQIDKAGEVLWRKPTLDLDSLRSDADGLFWQLQGSADGETYLAIGASPASLCGDGVNVFGSCDIRGCAAVLLSHASRSLRAVLPPVEAWQCRRIDVTANYALPDTVAVDFALAQLMRSDGSRRKASTQKGNTVYWAPTSQLRRGKAYNKGRHLRMKVKRGAIIGPDVLALADRLLRLELTLGGRYCRELERAGRSWLTLTAAELSKEHAEFFGQLNAVCEVEDMERDDIIQTIARANGISESRARSAFRQYADMRRSGFEAVKAETTKPTFYRNNKYLTVAGFTVAHLKTAHEVPFKRVQLLIASPVSSWDELRAAA